MIETYQWPCNADSSHSSEYYRLQLFVAVDFMPDNPSGIWRAGSNTVVAMVWFGLEGSEVGIVVSALWEAAMFWVLEDLSFPVWWLFGGLGIQRWSHLKLQDGAKERRKWERSFSVACFL